VQLQNQARQNYAQAQQLQMEGMVPQE